MAKRVVTGVNRDGRSYIVSCEEMVSERPLGELWTLDPHDAQLGEWIADISPDRLLDVGIEPGGAKFFRLVATQRDTERPFWHATRTIDFSVVIRGMLTLMLDEASVQVEKGDVVVQHATHHAWRVEGDEEAEMIVVGIAPARP